MKKTSVLITSLCALGAAVVMAAPVPSVNIVGYQTISCPRGYTLVASAFESLDGKVLKSVDVFGTNQLPAGATIYAWDQLKDGGPGYTSDAYSNKKGWDTNIVYKGGMGFWIYSPAEVNVSIAGQVPMASQVSNIVYNGYAMLGFPYTSSIMWTNTDLAQKCQKGSVLYWWDTAITNYQQNSKGKSGWDVPSLVITPSMGFWLYNPSGSITNFENRPYNP